MKILITGAYNRDIFSECMVAIVLGVISPNRRISRVRIPLANATEAIGKRGGQGCGGQIDDVVADQYGAQHLAGIIRNAENCFGAPVSVFRQGADPNLVNSGQCRLSR